MIKKTTLALLLILTSIYSYGQESSIELPLIGDRLSGAVSETEEEALGTVSYTHLTLPTSSWV